MALDRVMIALQKNPKVTLNRIAFGEYVITGKDKKLTKEILIAFLTKRAVHSDVYGIYCLGKNQNTKDFEKEHFTAGCNRAKNRSDKTK